MNKILLLLFLFTLVFLGIKETKASVITWAVDDPLPGSNYCPYDTIPIQGKTMAAVCANQPFPLTINADLMNGTTKVVTLGSKTTYINLEAIGTVGFYWANVWSTDMFSLNDIQIDPIWFPCIYHCPPVNRSIRVYFSQNLYWKGGGLAETDNGDLTIPIIFGPVCGPANGRQGSVTQPPASELCGSKSTLYSGPTYNSSTKIWSWQCTACNEMLVSCATTAIPASVCYENNSFIYGHTATRFYDAKNDS